MPSLIFFHIDIYSEWRHKNITHLLRDTKLIHSKTDNLGHYSLGKLELQTIQLEGTVGLEVNS